MWYSQRNVLASAVWVAAGLAYSSALAQSNPSASTQPNLRERLAAAVETVEGACASDLKKILRQCYSWRGSAGAVYAGSR